MEEILIDLNFKKAIHTTEGEVILDIALRVVQNGFITLFGKSGVGKTTLLRMIAGLTSPDSGYIKVGDNIWYDESKGINTKTQKRNIGFVFQDYALFPNMTVKEHLLYAQMQEDLAHVDELLNIFHLTGLSERKPGTLSGGQNQRLSVARALARKPQILLLDEPFSALDVETRLILQEEIILAHKNFRATTILVSHDIDEILKLSDHVYMIDNGKIVKDGKADEFFNIAKIEKDFSFPAKIVEIKNNIVTVLINGTNFSFVEENPNNLSIESTVQIRIIGGKVVRD